MTSTLSPLQGRCPKPDTIIYQLKELGNQPGANSWPNNENAENGETNATPKRQKKVQNDGETMRSPLSTQKSQLVVKSGESEWAKSTDSKKNSSHASEASTQSPTAMPSVKHLKGWLSEFEQKQKEHFNKTNVRPQGASIDNEQSLNLSKPVTPSRNGKGANSVPIKLTPRTDDTKRANCFSVISTPNRDKSDSSNRRFATCQENLKKNSVGLRSIGATIEREQASACTNTPTRNRDNSKVHCLPIKSTPRSCDTNKLNSFSVMLTPNRDKLLSSTRGTLNCPGALTISSSVMPSRRFGKPRIKKQEVEATDEGNATVHKLSEWLQDDPFEKRQRAVRKGAQVGATSRTFDPHQKIVVTRDLEQFKGGNVADRQKWLRAAFKQGEDSAEELSNVTEKTKRLESTFRKNNCARTGIMQHVCSDSNLVDTISSNSPHFKAAKECPSDKMEQNALSLSGPQATTISDEESSISSTGYSLHKDICCNRVEKRGQTNNGVVGSGTASVNNERETPPKNAVITSVDSRSLGSTVLSKLSANFGGDTALISSVQHRRAALEQMHQELRRKNESVFSKPTSEPKIYFRKGSTGIKKEDRGDPKKVPSELP